MALDKSKVNYELGLEVHEFLKKNNVENPASFKNDFSKVNGKIAKCYESILSILGLDLTDKSISGTPGRVSSMLLNETFWGLDYRNFPKMMVAPIQYTGIILERRITVESFCEHHLVPIEGLANVAYISDGDVIGLSKINRIVEFFSRRPQVQERLSAQIFYAMQYLLNTKNVAVNIVANHYCVRCRGVQDKNSDTVTSLLGGSFLTDGNVNNEFYQLLRL